MSSSVVIADAERAAGAPDVHGGNAHRQPELDGIRGIAILLVLCSHAANLIPNLPQTRAGLLAMRVLSPGWGGVDIFFALSGFLITSILLKSKGKPHFYSAFYARRVLRIFPIYYLFLLASLVICTQVPVLRESLPGSDAHLPATAAQRTSFFLYLQTIPVFWPSLASGLTGLWGAYWSLAVEEQFYFVWPVTVKFSRERVLFWVCIAGLIAGPLIRRQVRHLTGDHLGLFHFPITRLDGLFAGAAVAIYQFRQKRSVPLAWSVVCIALGGAMMGAIYAIWPDEILSPGYYLGQIGPSAFAFLATGLLIASQHRVAVLGRVLNASVLQVLGKYSYGVYIFHITVFFLAAALVKRVQVLRTNTLVALLYDLLAMAAALLVAVASYHLIEARFLALKRYFPSPAAGR